MATHMILIGLGCVLVLAGIMGGGLSLKELKLPPLNRFSRIMACIVGLVFIVAGIYIEKTPNIKINKDSEKKEQKRSTELENSDEATEPLVHPGKLSIATNFDKDAEGWSPYEANGFNWKNNDNNYDTSGGHLEATDGSRSPWYFQADEEKYSGDLRHFYGGTFSYLFMWWADGVSKCKFRGKNKENYDESFGDWWKPDVELLGSNDLKLGYFLEKPPDEYQGRLVRYKKWERYTVPISADTVTADGYGWIKHCERPPCDDSATEAEIKSVLQDVKRVLIRGEYCFGAGDRGLLDEVRLKASDAD